jgi:hypothetical protein
MFYGQRAMSPEVTSDRHLEGGSKTFRGAAVKVSQHTQPPFWNYKVNPSIRLRIDSERSRKVKMKEEGVNLLPLFNFWTVSDYCHIPQPGPGQPLS